MTAITQHWIEAIDKEEYLRLRWYIHNEEKIRYCAEKHSVGVSEDQNKELLSYQSKMVKGAERKIKNKSKMTPPLEEESKGEKYAPSAGIMRPVLLEVNDMIYKQGRVPYLKKRYNTLPDGRYYYKETSGFEYGWKMWDCAKTLEMKRYGKSAIVKQTFYRRRAGIEQDPVWYRSPIRLSPTVCNDT